MLSEDGAPTGVTKEGWRPRAYLVPIPPAKAKAAKQAELALEIRDIHEAATQIRAFLDAGRRSMAA